MLESQSRARKTRNLRQKIDSLDWRPVPGKVGHKNEKTTLLVTYPQQNPKPKTENFISVETGRLAQTVDGLNSFLALTADELFPRE